jgi:hypothetical protein
MDRKHPKKLTIFRDKRRMSIEKVASECVYSGKVIIILWLKFNCKSAKVCVIGAVTHATK